MGTAVEQVELFRKDNLDPTKTHRVVLTTTQGGSWLDLDYIVYETLIGKEKRVRLSAELAEQS